MVEQTKLLVGQQISHYRILAAIGEGGMGEVYLAEDTRLGRKIALKLLPTDFAEDHQRVRRFAQEARAASTLNHPNVCMIHEIDKTEDGRHLIAMEYVDGVTLRQLMAKKRVKLSEVLDVATQIAAALAAAHGAGIVHRDIKPENVMVRSDAVLKVLDFGLAKRTAFPLTADSQDSTKVLVNTAPGTVMGTVAYMSPEQARVLEVDARTDIWSLGVVLYEMVAGRVPFEGATNSDVIVSILEREPLSLTFNLPEIPTELERIVSKALRKEREERYQVIKDMFLDLKSLKQNLEFEVKLEHTPKQAGGSKETSVNTAPGFESLVGNNKLYLMGTLVIVAAIIITVMSFAVYRPRTASKTASESAAASDRTQPDARGKLYSQMTKDEQQVFVGQQAQRISAMLGERPTPLSNNAVGSIRKFVDSYAARANSLSEETWKEGLRAVFGRASQYAPVIVRSFEQRGVPPIIGLYIPMVESEYRACLENDIGSKGLYQFMPGTARSYGVSPNRLLKKW